MPDVSKLRLDGTSYDIKDATARTSLENILTRQGEMSTQLDEIAAKADESINESRLVEERITEEAGYRSATDEQLQAQISQLLAPSGEAPNAAEVLDARIGLNGKVYSSLGDSIRQQTKDIYSSLNGILAYNEIDFSGFTPTTPAFLRTNGTFNTNSTQAAGIKYYKIPTTPGTKYRITGQTAYEFALYGFLNSNNTVISYYPTASGTSTKISHLDYEVTAPSNAAYLVINDGSGWILAKPGVSQYGYTTGSDIVKISEEEYAELTISDTSIIENSYVTYDGKIGTDSNLDIIKIPVKCGERYHITGFGRYGAVVYGMYAVGGDNEYLVEYYPKTAQGSTPVAYDLTVDIPVGIDYLLVNDPTKWGIGSPTYKKIVIGGYIDARYKITSENIVDSALSPLFNKKINVIGDSMVYGYQVDPNYRWTTLLANDERCYVTNYGINGCYLSNTTPMAGVDPVVQRYVSMRDDADYVIVFAGTNDANNNVPIGTDDSTDTTTIKGALNVLCAGLIDKYPSAKIGFITPYLRLNSNAFRNTIEAIKTVCSKYSIPVFDNASNGGVCFQNSTQVSTLCLDDTHLNQLGMRYAVSKYKAFIKSL